MKRKRPRSVSRFAGYEGTNNAKRLRLDPTMRHVVGGRAKSWDQARRVAAKVEWHQVKLFPRVDLIVTNFRQTRTGSET